MILNSTASATAAAAAAGTTNADWPGASKRSGGEAGVWMLEGRAQLPELLEAEVFLIAVLVSDRFTTSTRWHEVGFEFVTSWSRMCVGKFSLIVAAVGAVALVAGSTQHRATELELSPCEERNALLPGHVRTQAGSYRRNKTQARANLCQIVPRVS